MVNIMRHLGDRHAPADVIRRIELVQAIEDPGFEQRYVIFRLQIDCQKLQFLVDSTLIGHADGTVKPKANETSDWVDLPQGRYGEGAAGTMACPPPKEYLADHRKLVQTSIVTDAYRAADAVDWLRKALWSKPGEFVVEGQ